MLRPQVITAGSHGASARSTLFGGYRAGLLPSCHRAGGSLLRRARPAPQGGRVVGGRKVGRGCGGAVYCASPGEVGTAVARTAAESPTKVKAVVAVKLTVGGMLTNVGLSRGLDDITDLLGKSLYIELVSAELDPGMHFCNLGLSKGYAYLPSQTPSGLQRLREEELQTLRGDGQGERKRFERVYDYDVYNDLGQPDSSEDLARPVLGGHQHPYPRRCRTGRPSTKKDPHSEKRSNSVYVPRDESFSEVKGVTFSAKTVRSVVHALLPSLETAIVDPKLGFPLFTSIDTLFNEGLDLPPQQQHGFFQSVLPRLVKAVSEGKNNVLLFETPALLERDKFSWFRDEEFSRQALAGVNPFSIQLVTEFPFVSKLDPDIYGPPESAITKEIIEREMKGMMTLEEAIEGKRLFMIDYHDLLLPYVNKIRELPGNTLYGSRTIFFLTDGGTLMPIAIELTRPKSPTRPQWKQVFTHTYDATGTWLWRLAKLHVAAHDAGYHQLVVHWLRTHCCTEPYIIAANRHLSVMHPIHRLLRPHFRYTMEINALAREALINAGGTIEMCFFPGKYAAELSSVAYDKLWRFDQQSLPADLISRGMAVEDPTAEHGLRLTIEDYPFAADGLLIWSTLKQWVEDYVTHYYADADAIKSDGELLAWWEEIRTEGHADKKDEPWWPKLETPADLVGILTTIIWVTSGHHAAVNFGQYHYGGYFPNRPTLDTVYRANHKPPVRTSCGLSGSTSEHRAPRSLANA
ncbi:hypothetical protein Taro_026230 [Colocasia esculenta]|uniref:Lipoxygenase n=1 Tax=Colocasia esculenta TaxID=4460 RepID=A0A843VCC6_COLES|nr:hypothetical protein [Colocasia esculenta]